MAKQTINLGTAPTGSGGDTPRTAFQKVIDNFTELYGAFGATGDSAALPAALPVSKGGTGGTSQPFTRANSVGTVSQASGIPTGAVIEYGANANGSYIKWADGTMICTRQLSVTAAINTVLGNLYYNPGTGNVGIPAQAMPATFAAIPTTEVKMTCAAPGSSTGWLSGFDASTTSQWGRCYQLECFSRSSLTYTLEYFAIGRWY